MREQTSRLQPLPSGVFTTYCPAERSASEAKYDAVILQSNETKVQDDPIPAGYYDPATQYPVRVPTMQTRLQKILDSYTSIFPSEAEKLGPLIEYARTARDKSGLAAYTGEVGISAVVLNQSLDQTVMFALHGDDAWHRPTATAGEDLDHLELTAAAEVMAENRVILGGFVDFVHMQRNVPVHISTSQTHDLRTSVAPEGDQPVPDYTFHYVLQAATQSIRPLSPLVEAQWTDLHLLPDTDSELVEKLRHFRLVAPEQWHPPVIDLTENSSSPYSAASLSA